LDEVEAVLLGLLIAGHLSQHAVSPRLRLQVEEARLLQIADGKQHLEAVYVDQFAFVVVEQLLFEPRGGVALEADEPQDAAQLHLAGDQVLDVSARLVDVRTIKLMHVNVNKIKLI